MHYYMNPKAIILFGGLFWSGLFLQAQDQQFTQFYSAPLTLNPALTGAFDGKFRVSAIYRDQWRSILDNPYVTFSTAMDPRFGVRWRGAKRKDAAALGLMFYSDKVPGFDFSTNQISISGAFHKALDLASRQFLSIGIQGGIAQRGINYEDLTFSDQFNGTDNYSDLTAEQLPENTYSYADFSVGLNYSVAPRGGTHLFVGAAMHHFLQPSVSFYDQVEDGTPDNQYLVRYSAQVGLHVPLGDKVQLLPRANISMQGQHMVMNAGTNFRFVLSEYANVALHLGGWVRPVRDELDEFGIDAVVAMIGVEYSNVLFGFSYDANLNDLTNSRQGQGAFEISVAYLGEYENDAVLCPKF